MTEGSFEHYTVGDPIVDMRAPTGPINERWEVHKFAARLVNPANRRKLNLIVIGTGLAGGLGRGHPR